MRPSSTLILLLVLSVGILPVLPSARADEVVRKDGKSVKGFIVSQTASLVRIMDSAGRIQRIPMKDIDAVIESSDTGESSVDAKLGEIDTRDPDDLLEVAKWAKEKKITAWRLVALQITRLDEGHEAARELLGHIKVGDTWYDNKRDAEQAQKRAFDDRMKDEGYVPFRDGWIKKEDRALATRDKDAFVKDEEGVYRDKAEVMKAKGYVLLEGNWVKAGDETDREQMNVFKTRMGAEDLWVISSKHYRLFAQLPPAQAGELVELCEQTYEWFLKKMELAPDVDLFGGRKGHLWILKDRETLNAWIDNYRNDYSIDARMEPLIRSSGAFLADAALYALHVEEPNSPIRNQLVNHSARMALAVFSRGVNRATSSWLGQGFGVFAEEQILGNGLIVHSTLAKYSGDGGRANKEFTTKDAPDRCKGNVREGSDEPIVNLDKIELNMLSGDHIAKAYTLITWLMRDKPAEFRQFLRARNTAETMDAAQKAFGWTTDEIDKAWREMVKSEF